LPAPPGVHRGRGEVIEYDGRTDIVRFIPAPSCAATGAVLSDQVTGAVIVYNNLTDVFTVDGQRPRRGRRPNWWRPRARAMLAPRSPPRGGSRLQPRPRPSAAPQHALGGG
jgi:lipopolysaccharide export system protein LptA